MFLTRENLSYLEYDGWGSSRTNKYICLLTSRLSHALQNEIINLNYFIYYIITINIINIIYIYIYIYTYIYIHMYK